MISTAVTCDNALDGVGSGDAVLDKRIRMGYLGGRSDHCENITRLLQALGCSLVALPDSAAWGAYKTGPSMLGWKSAAKVWRRSARALSQVCGTRHPGYLRHILDLIDRNGLNCLIAYWSTDQLADIIAIKTLRPRLKVILNLLCHPLGLSAMKVGLQNWQFRRSIGYLDGLIMPSEIMKTYLEQTVRCRLTLPCLIWPPYYSRHFYPQQRRAACPHTPNVLFIGRMDWLRAQPSDNVGTVLSELLRSGVHVYHHAWHGIPPHPNRHTFEYLPLSQTEEFATAFDASLIVYNLDVCRRPERFAVTVPDRLVASVTAGIPIAIPAQGYGASHEYLAEYKAVIPFTSPTDLADRLADRAAVAQLRKAAQDNSHKYVGEKHLAPLARFLRQVARG